MNEFGKQIIFKQLLDRHGRVEIPRIQRDYAQGREAETEVRQEFLGALHGALSLPADDPNLPLNLDFVYGSVEGTEPTRFLPLDGQQRLTTLFLLHWYASWKDGCSDEFRAMLCDPHGSRFTYSVRPSSAEFFDALANFTPDISPDKVSKLSELIKDQAWYFRHWRLDPTIQSAIRMLDSIHGKFLDCENLFQRLIDEERPAITFQLLDLANFGLSDDLYIKMNARGKPLTSFETFKARYQQELETQYGKEARSIEGNQFPVAEFFSRRMDTSWADFFWAHRDPDSNLFDEAVMNIFRSVILISLDPGSDRYTSDILWLKNESKKSSFTSFQDQDWITREFSDTLLLLLETWASGGAELTTYLPDKRYFDENSIFEKAATDPTNLAYPEIIQLAAYVGFLGKHQGDEIDSQAFQEWMRIVFNLATNTSYDRASDLQRSISGIRMMQEYSGDALTYFSENEKPTTGFSPQQIQEERLKAYLILSNEEWRPLIDHAESHGYFKGQIEFLLDFAGVLEKWKEGGDEWSDETHTDLQTRFERNLVLSETMFANSGLAKDPSCTWERALLSIGDYLLPSGRQNLSFLVNASTDQGSWKRLLRGSGAGVSEGRAILRQLWDQLSPEDDIREQLNSIIEGDKEVELWRKAFIEHPSAINYCNRRVIRKDYTGNEVYLLKTTQMNGKYAELFTYCLYEAFGTEKFFETLDLETHSYSESMGTAIEPGIRLAWDVGHEIIYFELERGSNNFIVYKNIEEGKQVPDYLEDVVQFAGFQKMASRVVKRCNHEGVREVIRDLNTTLLNYRNNLSHEA